MVLGEFGVSTRPKLHHFDACPPPTSGTHLSSAFLRSIRLNPALRTSQERSTTVLRPPSMFCSNKDLSQTSRLLAFQLPLCWSTTDDLSDFSRHLIPFKMELWKWLSEIQWW